MEVYKLKDRTKDILALLKKEGIEYSIEKYGDEVFYIIEDGSGEGLTFNFTDNHDLYDYGSQNYLVKEYTIVNPWVYCDSAINTLKIVKLIFENIEDVIWCFDDGGLSYSKDLQIDYQHPIQYIEQFILDCRQE